MPPAPSNWQQRSKTPDRVNHVALNPMANDKGHVGGVRPEGVRRKGPTGSWRRWRALGQRRA